MMCISKAQMAAPLLQALVLVPAAGQGDVVEGKVIQRGV